MYHREVNESIREDGIASDPHGKDVVARSEREEQILEIDDVCALRDKTGRILGCLI